jgi:hypothetical protein
VSALSLGAASRAAETVEAAVESETDAASASGESSSSDEQDGVFVRLPGGAVLPVGIFRRLRERLLAVGRATVA